MFFTIGFLASIAIAFASPYFWQAQGVTSMWAPTISTAVALIVLAGGGLLIDRKRRATRRHERAHANPNTPTT